MPSNKNEDKPASAGAESIDCGIDLGTTNSLCVWVSKVDPKSKPPYSFEFAMHRALDLEGKPIVHRVFPSVVAVDPKSAEMLVGLDAERAELRIPKDTVHSIKRLMGRRYDDPDVVELRKRARFTIEKDEAGMAVVVLAGTRYNPVEISAAILRRIKTDAETQFRKKIAGAIITVPAFFDDIQKRATWQAAIQAGLTVKRLVSEPVAAAFTYGYGLVPGNAAKILVFDLGGGTFDVSILRISYPLPMVLVHEGDTWLGGDDVDASLVTLKRVGIQKSCGVDPAIDPSFMVTLAREVRHAKEVICHSNRDIVVLDLGGRLPVPGGGEPVRVPGVSVSRAEIASAAVGFVEKAVALVKRALAAAGATPRDIDRVILVGGGSYLIGVREGLRLIFPPERVAEPQDPIAAVAVGAGVLARLMVGTECPQDGLINDADAVRCRVCGFPFGKIPDVLPKSYGVEVAGGGYREVLIKGSPCPSLEPGKRPFYTSCRDQTRVYLPIYQGECPQAANNSLQGYITVQLPEPKPLHTRVDVSMSVDSNQLLQVEVVCEGFRAQSAFRAGDWSRALSVEIERARHRGLAVDVASTGESVLQEWVTTPRDSEREREVESRGRQLLANLRARMCADERAYCDLLWRRYSAYVEVLPASVGDAVRALLAVSPDAVFDDWKRRDDFADSAMSMDPRAECVMVMLLRGRASADPDESALAQDLRELDAIMTKYRDAVATKRVADPYASEARQHLDAVIGREYYRRIRAKLLKSRHDGGILIDEIPLVDRETRSY
jgi:molecular chaperone DnaK